MKMLHVRVTDEQNAELTKRASEAKMNLSEYIRSLLFVEDEKAGDNEIKENLDHMNRDFRTVTTNLNTVLNGMLESIQRLQETVSQMSDNANYDSLLLQQILYQKIIRDKSKSEGYGHPTKNAINYAQEILNAAYDEANKAFEGQKEG